LDLEFSQATVTLHATEWIWKGRAFPYLQAHKPRTIFYWGGSSFQPAARFTTSLVKLIPTQWGPPTFEIDGIKMLPTATVSPYADAERKTALIAPRGKRILDTCGGLGYFAAWCLCGKAAEIVSYEKNPDVIWLRSLNPWAPQTGDGFTLTEGDITQQIIARPRESADAILHDPPRFGIAGELYSQAFYEQLARVLTRKGVLFHYTGSPNKLTSGRDVRNEVATRLRRAGFATTPDGDGILAVKT
jgi:predicted methyltransferase